MESLSITAMKNANLATIDRDELVDIRDVKVNTSLPKRERAIDFIRQIGNPYCYRHGKYVVKVGFSDTEVSLEERLAGYILSKCRHPRQNGMECVKYKQD